jgi:hypothetical protein
VSAPDLDCVTVEYPCDAGKRCCGSPISGGRRWSGRRGCCRRCCSLSVLDALQNQKQGRERSHSHKHRKSGMNARRDHDGPSARRNIRNPKTYPAALLAMPGVDTPIANVHVLFYDGRDNWRGNFARLARHSALGGHLLPATIAKSAVISPCGRYRYQLRREWDETLPPLVAGMLNPSIADAEIDDATITRSLRRAASNGCGSLIVWNLGAGRATDPDDWMAMVDPMGPENDLHIRAVLNECLDRNGIALAAWGARGVFRNRDSTVLELAAEIGVVFHCLGTTKDGHPRHPLYVALDRPLVPWRR